MDRVSRRQFAALRLLRLLLLAVSVCLAGTASASDRSAASIEASSPSADTLERPAPGPAVLAEPEDVPRGAEDDQLAHRPGARLTVLTDVGARRISVRSPASAPPPPLWQPHSARGPPSPSATPPGHLSLQTGALPRARAPRKSHDRP